MRKADVKETNGSLTRLWRTLPIAMVLFTLTLMLGAGTVSASGAPPVDAAQNAGLAFVTSVAPKWKPGWTNISLTNPQEVYGLDGAEVGYLFAVQQGSEVVGTLVIGGEGSSYHPFELVAQAPPSSPDSDELSKVIENDLSPQLHKVTPRSTGRLFYLGYRGIYEIYEIAGEDFAFDLVDRTIRPSAELGSNLSQTGTVSKSGSFALDSEEGHWSDWEVIDGVPIYGQLSSDVDKKFQPDNCGPTTEAMIVDYYRVELGYSDFDGWTDNHDTLYDTMNTNGWCKPSKCRGTSQGYFASGWKKYAKEKGYSFRTTVVTPALTIGQEWNKVKESIDDDRPLGVMFSWCHSATDWHWNAIKGYGTWVNTDDEVTDYMVVNDPAGKNGSDGIVSWSSNWHCLVLVLIEPK